MALATTRITEAESQANGTLRLRWHVRSNAQQKAPFQIQFADDLSNWKEVQETSISFTDEFAEWTDQGDEERSSPGNAARRYYRVLIQDR